MWASPLTPARKKLTYMNRFCPIARSATAPLTISSFPGALPVMHCQAPGSSSLLPSPKLSSPCPEASMKSTRLGRAGWGMVPAGSVLQSIGSPGGSSTRLPSISKLPTELPANVAGTPLASTRTISKKLSTTKLQCHEIFWWFMAVFSFLPLSFGPVSVMFKKRAGVSRSRPRNVLTLLHQAQDDSLPASPGLLLLRAGHDSHVHLLSARINTFCEFTYTVL